MSVAYGLATVCALVLSCSYWSQKAASDSNLLIVYVAALCGAMIGAVTGYVFAEGVFIWRATGSLVGLLGGKTILGGLIGGYLAVEGAKWATSYRRVTGDLFATVVPISIAIGRTGCLYAGCCLGAVCELRWYALIDAHGISRWPAIPLEIVLNLVAAAAFFALRRHEILVGQHFYLYMIGYGAFRFMNEFIRESLPLWHGLSGYHLQALMLLALGTHGFVRRRRIRTART
jgi:phosphatidylglycerol:prolipoprotein diacylglycerol transferase